MKNNVISRADILADFYGLGNFIRRSNDEITFFKNGGGAHLDLIVAKYILTAWEKNKYPKS